MRSNCKVHLVYNLLLEGKSMDNGLMALKELVGRISSYRWAWIAAEDAQKNKNSGNLRGEHYKRQMDRK